MARTSAQSEQVSPPAGIGSTPGMGEAFQMNLSTGQGTYSYKLAIPAGVAEHTPRLSLEYTHTNRMEQFGQGWSLPMRTIRRRLEVDVESDSSEVFLDSGMELIELNDGSYAPVRETLFTRYLRQGQGWLIQERNGVEHRLGTAAAARIEDPSHSGRVFEWLLDKTTDASGNEINFAWNIDEGFAYPSEIR